MSEELNKTVEKSDNVQDFQMTDVEETVDKTDIEETVDKTAAGETTDIVIPDILGESESIKPKKRISKKKIIVFSSVVLGLVLIAAVSFVLFNFVSNSRQIKAVEESINSIGQIELTTECQGRIDTAVTAYNALSEKQKEKVNNVSTLTSARSSYNSMWYYNELIKASNFVNKKATAALEILGDIKIAWNNVIYKKTDEYNNGNYDFDTALKAYWGSLAYLDNSLLLYDDIDTDDYKKKITDYLTELKNPPENYKNTYEAFTELYASYTSMVPLTKSINHNYNSFSSEVNKLSSDYKTKFGQLKALIPEVK